MSDFDKICNRVIKEMWKLTEWEETCVREGIRLYRKFQVEDGGVKIEKSKG